MCSWRCSPCVEVGTFRELWRVRRVEFYIAVITLLGVLTMGSLEGILVAVVFTILDLMRRLARPHDAVLGKYGDLPLYVDVAATPDAREVPGLLLYRLDAPLVFANAEYVRQRIEELVAQAEQPAHWLVIDASGMNDIDTTAAEMLRGLLKRLHAGGLVVALAQPHAAGSGAARGAMA